MTLSTGNMKRPRATALLMAACVALCLHSAQAIAPILVRGNKMYNEQTKERFFIKGVRWLSFLACMRIIAAATWGGTQGD